jgi:hypothetical protein
MKKIIEHKPLSMEYGPLVIWADDIEDIFQILSPCKTLSFVSENMEYNSIDEFVSDRKLRRPKSIKFYTEEPFVNVDIENRSAKVSVSRLSVAKNEIEAIGIFTKLCEICSRCERRPRFIYSKLLYVIIVAVAGISIRVDQEYITMALPVDFYMSTLLLASAIIIPMIISFSLLRSSIIMPIYKIDKTTFFARNKDNIAVALGAAMIGAIFGAVATKAVDRVWPPSAVAVTKPPN